MSLRCSRSALTALLGALVVVVPLPAAAGAAAPDMAATVAAGAPGSAGDGEDLVLVPDLEQRVLRIVNRHRAEAGCPAVRPHRRLRQAARAHTVAMAAARTMAHYLPGEPTLGQRATAAGYRDWRRLAENIATGYATPGAVMRAWMESPGHRANIMDCGLRELGVGVVRQGPRLWWTQDFGRR
ncbi:CAP domain-containing protein [Nocardioides sp. BYT-33-1]|uniref:CAP domain-containing protein n=1 Tax=Nocardioides sp. BYT-33-1 TaxID=3416952 RepID=UPI003F52A1DC